MYSFEKEQARLQKLMEDCLAEESENLGNLFDDQSDESEVNFIENEVVNSDTEQEISDGDQESG